MRRHPLLIAAVGILATYAWFLIPDGMRGPAVLWPSLLAVGLAFATRDIYLSLFTGALGGALLLQHGNPALAFLDLFTQRLLPVMTDRWNLSVLLFTLLMGGFVEVLNRNGSMATLTGHVMGRSGGARRAGLGAYWVGWLVFFDGLANAILVGKTLRPIADRARLSREKLAFIVDSTSSPIAGLALISTWVAYEMSVIREGLVNAGEMSTAPAIEPFGLLVLSLPFRFYNWFMLWLVFLVVWLMRDWGPMLAAEQAARRKPAPTPTLEERPTHRAPAALALVPLGVLIAAILVGLFVDGGGLDRPVDFQSLVKAFGVADAALVFVIATVVASGIAMGLSWLWQRTDSTAHPASGQAFLAGIRHMFLPALILVFAWMLNSVIQEMGTATYLVSLMDQRLPAGLLPALVFLAASVVSFSTGTSWGTMAIVMPLVIPLAVTLGGLGETGEASPVMVGTIGAVLAGAVFGDHCSPISDTTVVSSFSCDCEVMAHVRTQMPYALVAATVALVLGYGPTGFGVTPWVLLPAGAACLWALVRFRGRPTTEG